MLTDIVDINNEMIISKNQNLYVKKSYEDFSIYEIISFEKKSVTISKYLDVENSITMSIDEFKRDFAYINNWAALSFRDEKIEQVWFSTDITDAFMLSKYNVSVLQCSNYKEDNIGNTAFALRNYDKDKNMLVQTGEIIFSNEIMKIGCVPLFSTAAYKVLSNNKVDSLREEIVSVFKLKLPVEIKSFCVSSVPSLPQIVLEEK